MGDDQNLGDTFVILNAMSRDAEILACSEGFATLYGADPIGIAMREWSRDSPTLLSWVQGVVNDAVHGEPLGPAINHKVRMIFGDVNYIAGICTVDIPYLKAQVDMGAIWDQGES